MRTLARKVGALRWVRRSWIELELLWEPRDMWVGVYWKRYPLAISVYVCVLPMLPVHVYVELP